MMVALAQATWAIDNDNDGISDVWQSTYGVGAEQAADDPDGDGDINLHEAWAGTDPGNPESNSRLNHSRDGDQVTLTWSGVSRMPYIVETSTNLVSWSQVGDEVVSVNGTETASISLSSTVKTYYRLRIRSTLDTDGDNLCDWEELLLGTTIETLWDTDGDLMPDGWEYTYMLEPGRNDSDEDPDEDGVSNLNEYLNGTNPQDPGSK
jgi:hypothetical protein